MAVKLALSWLKQGWTTFVDPSREKRLEDYTIDLHKQLAQLKSKFQFSVAAELLEIDEVERPEVARRLYSRCLVKAWSDGEITDQENRSLNWLSEALGLPENEVATLMRERAQSTFSSSLAKSFSDGVLDDDEYAKLERIAGACGDTAAGFFRNQFREDGEAFIRSLFLRVWEDGRMDESEWKTIQSTVKRLGLQDSEFRDAICAPAQQLVEHFLTDFKSDDEISDEEEQFLEWMLTNLISDHDFTRYVRAEVAHVKALANIRNGRLPSIKAIDGVALKAGELTHYHSPAKFTYFRRRGGESVAENVQGIAVITDYRLLFVSTEQSLQLVHSGILAFHRISQSIELQTSGRGAGVYQFLENPEFGVEIWVAAIGKANQVLIEPQIKKDARKISRDVRQRVWQKYGGRCAECNSNQYLEFDHIIPVARGGGNAENNIQLLCRKCNSRKSDAI